MKTIIILLFIFLSNIDCYPQWSQKADFAGSSNRSMAVGFSIGNKGYVGTGSESVFCVPISCEKDYNDFWEYDPTKNFWTRKAFFGGETRIQAVGFSIGDKGYIGTGGRSGYKKDFWEYNPANDTWSRKADFPGYGRWAAVGFSIGNKGYIGLGLNGTTNFIDFWEYDPLTDVWTKKADFPGIARSGVVFFSIGNKGYVGLGLSAVQLNDFWEYDPVSNTWKQIADFPGSSRQGAKGFSIGSKGYIVAGHWNSYLKDLWQWDSNSNTWLQKEDFGGSGRIHAIGFSIDSKAYFGTGNSSSGYKSDFWEYNSGIISGSNLIENENTLKIYPNPATNKITVNSPEKSILEITDINGQTIETFYQNDSNMTIDISDYHGGIYFVKVTTKEKIIVQKIIKTGNQ